VIELDTCGFEQTQYLDRRIRRSGWKSASAQILFRDLETPR